MSEQPTRVLLIEDNRSDAELVLHQLKASGLQCEHRVVATAKAVRDALVGEWDVVLADFNLPGFNALDVLAWLRERDLDVPLIVVTGMIGEETAARCIIEGCTDYLVKDRLARLPQAVRRALDERRTEREKRDAEARLRDSERRLRALIEHGVDAITLLDREGRITFCAGAPVLGHAPEDVVGRPGFEMVHADDLERVTRIFESSLAAPREVFEAEYRAQHRDGTWRWVETVVVNLLGEPGVAAVVTNNRDVTERRRTQEALREHGERLQVINQALGAYLENADLRQAVGAVLEHLLARTGSPCAFVAAPQAAGIEVQMRMADKPGEDVLHRADPTSALGRLIFEGRGLNGDGLAALGGPTGLPDCCTATHLVAVPLRVGEHVVGLLGLVNQSEEAHPAEVESLAPTVGTLYDIHTRAERHRQLERELSQAMKMEAVGRLAGGVAHDFNNLLTVVLGFGELAMNALPPGDKVRESLQEVMEAARSATHLTRQLLTFSRREVMKKEAVEPARIVANMARLLRRVIGEDIELVIAPDSAGEILADAGQIEQVVMNLAVNARDAMPHGGRLEIRCRDAGKFVILAVQDTGCGMTPDIVAHIFEPFFTTKDRGRGTGLGLSTIYGVVQQVGGRIDVDTTPGQGTTFTIAFPRLARPGVRPAWSDGQDELLRGQEKILLVEDADVVRRLACTVLEAAGYDVIAAAGPAEALQVLRDPDAAVDLLLTDVVMPEMSGRQLADEARHLRAGLPVLYMSGYTDDAVLRCGISQGEVPFLQKPFVPHALLVKVREVLHPAATAAR